MPPGISSEHFGPPDRYYWDDVWSLAGLRVLRHFEGQLDPSGYELRVTMLATADELAGAAELVMGKLDAVPVALVRGADFADQAGLRPESAGLRAISHGFPLVARDDHDTVEKASFLYDALYAFLNEPKGEGRR